MTTPDRRPTAHGAQDEEKREPVWFILLWVCFCGLLAWQQASFLEQYGFSWVRMAGILVLAVAAGLWLGELPPWRRLMAWRARRFGGVPGRPRWH